MKQYIRPFTHNEAIEGEFAVTDLSPRAQEYFSYTDVRLYVRNGLIYVRGVIDEDALTLEDVDEIFNELHDYVDALEAEWKAKEAEAEK